VQRGRRIAFDYGEVRIGVAASDPDGILASPHTTLTNNQSSYDLERSLKEIAEEIRTDSKPYLLECLTLLSKPNAIEMTLLSDY